MLLQIIRVVLCLAQATPAFAGNEEPRVRPTSAVARGSAVVTPAQSTAVTLTQRTARASSLVGEGSLQTEVRGIPLLSAFRLSFNNGDHKIRRIGFEPHGQIYLATYADQQPDDPFSALVTVWDAEGPSVGSINFATRDAYGAPDYTCIGDAEACGFAFPAGIVPDAEADSLAPALREASPVPVLSGFYLERQDTDANVRDISAAYGCGARGCRAKYGLSDSLGFDGRHISEGKTLYARSALVRASYALVPRRLVQTCQRLQGGRRPNQPDPAIRSRPTPGDPRSQTDLRAQRVPIYFRNAKIVLQSFSFHFTNGDHHLLDIGIEYDPSGAFYVTFGDNTRDDSYAWSLGYCVLKD